MANALRCSTGTVILLLFCIIAAESTGCPEDSVAGDDGKCKCVSPCPKHDCQPGQQPVRVNAAIPEKPGSCCPLYECRNQDPVSWIPPDDMNKCRDSSGHQYENGERLQMSDDPCLTCTCEAGVLNCQATMCRSCIHPLPRDPGECCPKCPPTPTPRERCRPLRKCELSNCELGLDTNELGCPICRCRSRVQNEVDEGHGNTDCPRVECDLQCEHGLLGDENGCSICQCRPHLGCPANLICQRKCPLGYRTNKRGCPTCRCLGSCLDDHNLTYPEGSTWSSEPCRSCTCEAGGQISCNETICEVACNDPLPPPPGRCCSLCPPTADQSRGWGAIPVALIVGLAVLCVLLMVHLVRGRFRARLAPSEADFAGFPQQYYKCVPVYETHVPVLQNAEKIAPL